MHLNILFLMSTESTYRLQSGAYIARFWSEILLGSISISMQQP